MEVWGGTPGSVQPSIQVNVTPPLTQRIRFTADA